MAGDLVFVLVVVFIVAVFALALVRRGQRSTESAVEVESEEDGQVTQKRTIVLDSGREEQY
jgi:membrane protein implicated in regulation of membrane protease activity